MGTRLTRTLTVATIFVAASSAAQQPSTHNHIPPVVNGIEHPQDVPDNRAWLAQLIASTSSEKDLPDTKAHALLHRQHIGLADSDSVLFNFRRQFDALTANYNNGKLGAQAQLDVEHNIDVLVANTVQKLRSERSDDVWNEVDKGIQREKGRITFHDEQEVNEASLRPHLQLAQLNFNQGSSQGYSQYVAVDGFRNGDASGVYITVYLSGATGLPYMQGIGAKHSVWITNQWDNNGVWLQSYGDHYPNEYLNFGNTIKVQPLDGLKHTLTAGAKIVCNYAGAFFVFVYSFLTTQGSSYFAYWPASPNNSLTYCGVLNTCTNPRPWLVDGDKVFVGTYQACPAGFMCNGICVRNPVTLQWLCPIPNTFMDVCSWLPYNPGPQFCTPHP